jgi:hypothetical protein
MVMGGYGHGRRGCSRRHLDRDVPAVAPVIAAIIKVNMTTKETKPRMELLKILMYEIRKYPECDHIISVAVRPSRRASDHCNWYAEWIVEDNQIKCPQALEITKQLQDQFDLA